MDQTQSKPKFRAQIYSDTTGRWVDGGLFGKFKDAEADMLAKLAQYRDQCCVGRVRTVQA